MAKQRSVLGDKRVKGVTLGRNSMNFEFDGKTIELSHVDGDSDRVRVNYAGQDYGILCANRRLSPNGTRYTTWHFEDSPDSYTAQSRATAAVAIVQRGKVTKDASSLKGKSLSEHEQLVAVLTDVSAQLTGVVVDVRTNLDNVVVLLDNVQDLLTDAKSVPEVIDALAQVRAHLDTVRSSLKTASGE